MDDVPRVQHIPQGLAHLPALSVPNHGVKKHLGAGREGQQRGLGKPVPGGSPGIAGLHALGVRLGSKSEKRNREHGNHIRG